MEKESWYVIQTLADHESRIKLMCEEHIRKDIKKMRYPILSKLRHFVFV